MDYREALGRWGALKSGGDPSLWVQYHVDLDVEGGYSSGGDDGYDSYATSPRVNIEVGRKGRTVYYDDITYDFSTLIREILEVADGRAV